MTRLRFVIGLVFLGAGLCLLWRASGKGSGATSDISHPQSQGRDVQAPNSRGIGSVHESERAEARTSLELPGAPYSILRITASDRERHAVLPGVRVIFVPDRAAGAVIAMPVDYWSARVGESPTTDNVGVAEFILEPGLAGTVVACDPMVRARAKVAPLSAGELRHLALDVETLPDVIFVGRVVSADDGLALPAARIHYSVDDGGAQPDSLGVFTVPTRSWRPTAGCVELEGYAPKLFFAVADYSTRERAMQLELDRCARLKIVVLAGPNPVLDARVILTVTDTALSAIGAIRDITRGMRTSWSAQTNADGVLEFLDVPPDVPLGLLVVAPGPPPLTENRRLLLSPGEVATTVIRMDDEIGSIRGTVTTREGQPVGGITISRVTGGGSRHLLLSDSDRLEDASITDGNGEFEFLSVPAGEWMVAPGPACAPYAGFGRLVSVYGGVTARATLIVDCDRFIAGTVFGPSGQASSGAIVSATSMINNAKMEILAGDDGVFRLGPLPDDAWALRAVVPKSGLCSGEATVYPGDSDVNLQVIPCGRLSGVAVDSGTREARDCAVRLLDASGNIVASSITSWAGAFSFSGLSPGQYYIVANAGLEYWGRSRPLDIADGMHLETVFITLEPAGVVTLVREGSAVQATCKIESNGVTIDTVMLSERGPQTVAVPPGSISLIWRSLTGDCTLVDDIDVRPGELCARRWHGCY